MPAVSASVSRAINAEIMKSDDWLDLLDGLLLGDGSLEGSEKSARLILNQTARNRDWVSQVFTALSAAGFPVAVGDRRPSTMMIRGKRCRRSAGVSLRTAYVACLGEQRVRWYPRGIKHVPVDVRLSPISIANWYYGDGTVGCKGYHAKFCTDSFTRRDVRRLVRQLKDAFGWHPLIEQPRNRILLCKTADRRALLAFLNTAGHVPTCFQHKLQLHVEDRRCIIHAGAEDRLRELRRQRISYRQISEELHMSKSGVFEACRRLGIS